MNKLYDFNIDLKLRLFYVLAWTACIANTLGYLANAVIYGLTMATFFPFACALIIYAASAYGIITMNTRVPVIIILLICDLIEFPVLYCVYGAYRLSYIMLGIVTTALFLSDKWRIAGTGLLVLFDGAFIVWRLHSPELLAQVSAEENLVSGIVTFLIACCSIVAMLSILLRQHAEQQRCLKEMTEELAQMAHLDPLTQLYNRRYLTQYIENKIANGESDFSVVLLDIDDFKAINDTYGHMYGDEVLQEFSKILMRHIKGHGIVSRFGGEEFMLVFNSTDRKTMRMVLDGSADDFKKYGKSSKGRELTFSGGEAVFHNEDMLVKLFDIADENLYAAKSSGKKHVVYE